MGPDETWLRAKRNFYFYESSMPLSRCCSIFHSITRLSSKFPLQKYSPFTFDPPKILKLFFSPFLLFSYSSGHRVHIINMGLIMERPRFRRDGKRSSRTEKEKDQKNVEERENNQTKQQTRLFLVEKKERKRFSSRFWFFVLLLSIFFFNFFFDQQQRFDYCPVARSYSLDYVGLHPSIWVEEERLINTICFHY